MLNELYHYLILNKIAAIPGVGNFAITSKPAHIDSGIIYPPQQQLLFQQGTALTDKKFYTFLAEQIKISEVDAVRKFQDFAYQLRKDIQSNSQVELSGLGIFKKEATGELAFESTLSLHQFFPTIKLNELAESVLPTPHSNQEIEEHGIEVYPEDEVVKKDRWWIWALILTIIALAAIGIYYMQEGAI